MSGINDNYGRDLAPAMGRSLNETSSSNEISVSRKRLRALEDEEDKHRIKRAKALSLHGMPSNSTSSSSSSSSSPSDHSTKPLSNKRIKRSEMAAIVQNTVANSTRLPQELVHLIVEYTAQLLSERIEMAVKRHYCSIDVELGDYPRKDWIEEVEAKKAERITKIISEKEFRVDPENYLVSLEQNPFTQSNRPVGRDVREMNTRRFIVLFLITDNKNPMKCMNRLKVVFENLNMYTEALSPEENLKNIQKEAKNWGFLCKPKKS